MKRVFSMYLIVLITSLFLTISCASAQEKEAKEIPVAEKKISREENLPVETEEDFFTLGKRKYTLSERKGECVLSYEKSGKPVETTLKIAPPCRAVRDNKNNIRYFYYKDIKADVFMIVGEVRETAGKPCGSKAQVVLVKKDSVSPGKTIDGTVCVLFGTDEKDFWLLSH